MNSEPTPGASVLSRGLSGGVGSGSSDGGSLGGAGGSGAGGAPGTSGKRNCPIDSLNASEIPAHLWGAGLATTPHGALRCNNNADVDRSRSSCHR